MSAPRGVLRGALGVAASVLAPLALRMQRARDASVVVLYHRVTPEKDPVYPCLSPDAFRAHCLFLRAHYTILPLAELVGRMARPEPLRGCCAVTFDDGYRDFATYALPILRELRIPVTHFLVSACVDGGKPPWTYRRSRVGMLGGRAEDQLDRLAAADRERRLAEVEDALSGRPPLPLMLRPHDIAAIDRDLVEWGSHTRSHAFLDRVVPGEVALELAESKQRLEEVVGRPVRYLAYPNGRFDERVAGLARECGYQAALGVGQAELRAGSPLFALPRFDVGGIPLGMLPLETTGVVEALRKVRTNGRRLLRARERRAWS